MNYKQQLALVGGISSLVLFPIMGFKSAVYKGNHSFAYCHSRTWSQSYQIQQILRNQGRYLQRRMALENALARKANHLQRPDPPHRHQIHDWNQRYAPSLTFFRFANDQHFFESALQTRPSLTSINVQTPRQRLRPESSPLNRE